MDKHEIARLFEEIGILLELQAENPFKIRAYHNAARALENLEEDLDIIVKEGRLREVSGIGEHIAEKISTLVLTGRLSYYEDLKKTIPEGLLELLKIAGLGGKKIKVLYEKLGVKTIEDLANACRIGTVAQLPHFGEKTQENILNSIVKSQSVRRFLWWDAMLIAQPILEGLSKLKEVQKAEIAGSLRRKLETIGDLDFLAASSKPAPIMKCFTEHPGVEEVLAKGPTKSSVRLKQGIQADLRVISEDQFPFALVYFTGSKDHNIKIRQRANELGFSLSEYGLEPLDPSSPAPFPRRSKKPLMEADIYQVLGLSYIPPELREEKGEIEAAEKGTLPILVEEGDIRGVFLTLMLTLLSTFSFTGQGLILPGKDGWRKSISSILIH